MALWPHPPESLLADYPSPEPLPADYPSPEPDGVTLAEREEQAIRVERVAFRAGRLGMGYDEGEVDEFLDRIVATLRGTTDQPVTAAEVRAARFGTVMFKPGYAVSQVDGFLAEMADVLEGYFGA
nr:hypothetical protein GCM10020093_100080 [Planobispora longispora]